MLARLKQIVASTPVGLKIQDVRWLADIRRYKSRLPRDQARNYDDYLARCRAGHATAGDPIAASIAEKWERDGYVVFQDPSMTEIAHKVDAAVAARDKAGPIWTDGGEYAANAFRDFADIQRLFAPDAPLSGAIRAAFGTEFKLYYCKLYRSRRDAEAATGSQLWHSDGGPGTCMNLMFSLTDLTADNGAMELLCWKDTLEVYKGERAHLRNVMSSAKPVRDALCSYYQDRIDSGLRDRVLQPVGGPGTALMFRNNLIHRGGFPRVAGVERRVFVFHVYPSDRPAQLDDYAREGLVKRGAYPKDPAFFESSHANADLD
jgi:hypothetical protein